ncbi:MAG TPA: ATP-dependent RNA helicase HrpA [Actinophytocola sp.]|uniref:ATP-dependent RNA helicase HrpA n=1 Tax=Actinophytocola sp. TaxID=1872138 RepID=UPI002DDDAA72|nr:ATP-dependent RNA helicase HrpA [Actinophytocola sp.]HEV2783230.1 ATP-dependent RNA helicase HrpA [Actinophytocola sp.]
MDIDTRLRLPELMLRDERRLRRRLDGVRKLRDGEARAAALAEIGAEIEAAQRRLESRRAGVPAVSYPAELPITGRREDILRAIRDNQVVIIAGETGSGKTTQIPKMCLELGRGVRGTIGHTQPRRIAARTVAERIAEELDIPLGGAVGWKVRFTDKASESTLVKVMTDGILLAEIQSDRMLRQYDTLIIDEAHERSLNIDFILGYVKQLLPRRPDLKVIITSATIDPERFARHFDDAPVIEVSGRMYPVEVRYRPIVDPDDPGEDSDRDQVQAIVDAVDELNAEKPGDILVFLSGEREIRDTADALQSRNLPDTEILPLYARLSAAEQHRVFQPHRGRRIVLATNVAETSLTVPGIKYVIDPGTARISRYSNRLKVQRLPIEPISRASANQRAGRCGRTSDGICIRLYTEDDYAARPEFTDPEIVRTNLASVILQMIAADLGDIEAFPFIDPPDRRHISDGLNLLVELGALDKSKKDLTPVGRKLAQLPIDPRLARMVLAADREGCVHEVTVIAAALSIQDPRERPAEHQQAADQKHARFADQDSDFLTLLNLWNYLAEQQKELSSNRFRKLCKTEFLNYLRVREWQDLYSQLRQVGKGLGVTMNKEPAEPRRIHTALLAGLLSHIGMKDPATRDYVGARNSRFGIFPGSALFKKTPRWVMAAELVETTRLWGRVAARIEPEWVEPLAEHLVKRSYSEPRWSAERGAVLATEKVTLYGLPVVVGRTVNYGRVDPGLSRELFIRHALVEGDWRTRHAFFHRNRALIGEVEELEHRARRRDILIDEQTLFDFYDERIGAEVVSARHFDSWWKKASRTQPDLLTLDREQLINADAREFRPQDFPDSLRHNGLELPLSYRFEPGERDDGVTVRVPVAVLNQLAGDGLPWQVPGLRQELVTALIRSLPKQLRRNFVPVPDFAKAVLDRLQGTDAPRLDEIGHELQRMTGVPVPRDAWRLAAVPEHLKATFRVVDEQDRTLAEGKDLPALKQRLRSEVRAALSTVAHGIERTGLTDWDFDELPRTVERSNHGLVVTAYPALVDEGDTVAVRLFDTEAEQRARMWRGTRRLVLLTVPSPIKSIVRRLPNDAKLTLSGNPHNGVADLLDDCVNCAADTLIAAAGGPAWNRDGFGALRDAVRPDLADTAYEVITTVRRILASTQDVDARLAATTGPRFADAVADLRAQRNALVYRGFITATGFARLPDLVRYLQGMARRLEKLPERPDRDADWMDSVHRVHQEYRRRAAQLPPSQQLRDIRWMIEELRISYFAQTLGTPYPVSEKRILRALDELDRMRAQS